MKASLLEAYGTLSPGSTTTDSTDADADANAIADADAQAIKKGAGFPRHSR